MTFSLQGLILFNDFNRNQCETFHSLKKAVTKLLVFKGISSEISITPTHPPTPPVLLQDWLMLTDDGVLNLIAKKSSAFFKEFQVPACFQTLYSFSHIFIS